MSNASLEAKQPTDERNSPMILPTSRTAALMARAHTVDADKAERTARRMEARLARRAASAVSTGRWAVVSTPVPTATTTGRSTALTDAKELLAGTDDLGDRNARRRECQMPARAMSMAATRGRVTPDGLASVLAWFDSPHTLAQLSWSLFLPAKIGNKEAVAILAEHGIDAKPADVAPILKSLNPSSGRNGRRPYIVYTNRPTAGRPSHKPARRPLVFGATPVPAVPAEALRTNLKVGRIDGSYSKGFDTIGKAADQLARQGKSHPVLLDAYHAAAAAQTSESA